MKNDPMSQFDFWIGTWNVSWGENENGINIVNKILDGRVVQENFSAPDLEGVSLSSCDPDSGIWRQTWVDNSGGYLDFSGKFEDGKMILSRKAIIKGVACQQRMVFYDIAMDTFEWNWERSDNEGATWNILWNIHYTRKK